MKRKLESKTSEIADVLLKMPLENIESISLMSGKTGIALFLFYYAKASGEERYYHHAVRLISQVFDEINSGKTYYSFAGGLSGIGWTVRHLSRKNLFTTDDEDPLKAVDDFLYSIMMKEIKDENFDYLHGALGVGTYFLSGLNNERLKYLRKLISELEKIAHKDKEGGASWLSSMTGDNDEKGYNLGLSHGLASIIAFLGKAYAKNISIEKTEMLLSGAVNFLLRNEQDISKNLSYFPNWVVKEGGSQDSRLAWCYGDLGIGSALLLSGRCASNKSWEEKALEILRYSTKRTKLIENAVKDAGLCHGTAGIAHIYNRIYNLTKIVDFQCAAEHWFGESLKMSKINSGFAGYQSYVSDTNSRYINEAGFLEGITGIGLAMLAAVSDIEPSWDEALLIST
ncbi:MAG: lanthionine synthetase C family protein [Bacteroidales bacterium]|nr:lanthionine synthetase C family protein [Bacteroidales bacterium]